MDFINSCEPMVGGGNDPLKGLDGNQRLGIAVLHGIMYFIAMLICVFIVGILLGCGAPRAVEEHHHHHYEADTAAVSSLVDGRLSSWRSEVDSAWSERISQYFSQQQQSEQQHETITETVTETVDSLGRKIRQEQRTISRDISRELQSVEQHITREYESRLHAALDSVDSCWQSRYDSIRASVSRIDSESVQKTPVGDARPWYRKLWDSLQWLIIGAFVAAAIWLTRRWWPIGK